VCILCSVCVSHPPAICPRAPKTSVPSRECCFFYPSQRYRFHLGCGGLRVVITFVNVWPSNDDKTLFPSPGLYNNKYIYRLPRIHPRPTVVKRTCVLRSIHYIPIIITVITISCHSRIVEYDCQEHGDQVVYRRIRASTATAALY